MSVVYWAELQGAGRRLGRLADRGAFNTSNHYFPGDIVTYSGSTYVALAERAPGGPTPGSAPDTWGTLSDVFGNVPLPAPAAVPHLTPGEPRLQGPYVVDYTDIPHDGDAKSLWTPAVGTIILRLFPDRQTVVQWDTGTLYIGQGVTVTSEIEENVITQGATGGIGLSQYQPLDNVITGVTIGQFDSSGNPGFGTAYICHTTDPVEIKLASTGGTDPGSGHVELYALVARALPVS